MIALDTNVLARSLCVSEGEQSERAAALVRRAAETGQPLFVSDVVLCELVWVLGSVYGFEPTQIAETVRRLLDASELVFGDSAALERALDDFVQGPGGLADYIIRAIAVEAGCTAVATFDRALLKQPGFVSP